MHCVAQRQFLTPTSRRRHQRENRFTGARISEQGSTSCSAPPPPKKKEEIHARFSHFLRHHSTKLSSLFSWGAMYQRQPLTRLRQIHVCVHLTHTHMFSWLAVQLPQIFKNHVCVHLTHTHVFSWLAVQLPQIFKIHVCVHLTHTHIFSWLAVQLPQIFKILQSRSGEGISLLSRSMLLAAVTSSITYSIAKDYPFRSGIQGSGIQGSKDPGIQGSGIQGSGIQGSGIQGFGIEESGIQGSRIQG